MSTFDRDIATTLRLAREIMDRADAEKRSLTPEEAEEFDVLCNFAESAQNERDAIEEKTRRAEDEARKAQFESGKQYAISHRLVHKPVGVQGAGHVFDLSACLALPADAIAAALAWNECEQDEDPLPLRLPPMRLTRTDIKARH